MKRLALPAFISLFAFAWCLMVTPSVLHAKVGDGRLTLTTERAVIFKDGYALLIKRATATADEHGRVFTQDVPDAAVLGSFWVTADSEASFRVMAEQLDHWQRDAQQPRSTHAPLQSLLAAANGRDVTLTLDDGQTLAGRCLGITQIAGVPHVLLAPVDHGDADAPAGDHLPGNVRTIALSRIVSLGGQAVESVGIADPQFRRVKRMTVDFGKQAAGKPVTLNIMYFRPGLRWIPTYRLSGEFETEGQLALQAEILNEAEHLDDVALDLVVGVPNFRFKDVISPLSLEPALRQALQQAAPQLMGQQMMSNSFTQRSGEWRAPGRPVVMTQGPDVNLPPELASTGEQDLFVYQATRFSLRRGGRALVPLWQSQVPLRHLYTLDLHVKRHGQTGSTHYGMSKKPSGGADGSPLRLMTNYFWHQFELSNTSKTPWTTGPTMIVKGTLPLGQELMTYTSPGSKSLLPVTVAVNLRSSLEETEIERTPNVLTWNRSKFSLIRKAGTVTVTSYQKEQSECRIHLSLGGKVTQASHDGDVRVNDMRDDDWEGGSYNLNNHSDVVWNLTLEPGQAVELTYECEFYVR